MADDGHDRGPGVPSISNRNVLSVVDLHGHHLPDGACGGRKVESLLNGQYLPLKAGFRRPDSLGRHPPTEGNDCPHPRHHRHRPATPGDADH
jgi:hypothetical protein